MKTKQIYLLVAASMMVVVGWAAWRFIAIPEDVDPPANTSLSAQKTTPVTQKATPATSPRTGRPIVSQAIETPEMKKARFTAEKTRFQASVAAMKDAQNADPIARSNEQKDRRKADDMAFLKSRGLPDEIGGEVYQKLRAKADLYLVHREKITEALQRGENYTAYTEKLRQLNADIEAVVGTENYQKIQYWEATLLERGETATFQRYLQSRSLPLTEQQEADIVDAMYQARGGKVGFPLMMTSTSMDDKLAYIDTVKQSLAPVLSANEVALLGQHLKEVAEKPLRMQALNESLQNRLTGLLKRAEDMKNQAKPPAPPR